MRWRICRYDGPTDTTTTNITVLVDRTTASFEVLDVVDPQPASAFYTLQIELLSPPESRNPSL